LKITICHGERTLRTSSSALLCPPTYSLEPETDANAISG